jgi:hypothetical protein
MRERYPVMLESRMKKTSRNATDSGNRSFVMEAMDKLQDGTRIQGG